MVDSQSEENVMNRRLSILVVVALAMVAVTYYRVAVYVPS